MEEKHLFRIRNAQIVQICSNKSKFLIGKAMNQIEIIEHGTVIIDKNGKILAVGKDEEIATQYPNLHSFDIDIDGTGKSVVPGLIDGHTHPVWSGDRVHEFAMKLSGATYMDIHKMGGGIGFTVECTKQSSEKELLDLLLSRLDRMLKYGTTTVEGKSGYGLETETEMKMLKVLHNAGKHHPIEIISTYLGAHSIPKGSTASQACEDIIKNQIPALIELQKKGEISPKNIDVFYEKGVFEEKETKEILHAGKNVGLMINFHGDELHPMKSGKLGSEVGAQAISHLECIDDEGIEFMAKNGIVAILLPTTAYILRLEYPPARKLIDNGVIVSFGSDFNPNAHCLSLPLVMHLGCINMRMTMNEALVAATLNSAASLGLSETHGSIEVGKYGDLVIINSSKWEHLIYELGDPPIEMVVKRGKVVVHNNTVNRN